MKVRILTPAGASLETEAISITLPGAAGQLTPMEGHDVLITPLVAGRVSVTSATAAGKAGGRQEFVIDGGLAEVVKDAVTVFTSNAVRATKPEGGEGPGGR